MNVYEKLMQVQSKLKAPKDQYNDFGKYHYRNCEDILESLKPLLAEVKAIVNLTDSIELIGNRHYLKATAIFIDVEKMDKIEVTALAREDETKKGMDMAQITGCVSSYARKYALNGLFCIDDTKDSDATNTHGKDSSSKTSQNAPQPTQGNDNGNGQGNKNNDILQCMDCHAPITKGTHDYSVRYYGHQYCGTCQKKHTKTA